MIYIAAVSFVLLVAIAFLGEKLLPFFGGDVDLARKVVVPSMMVCAAGAFGLPMPQLFLWIAEKQRGAVTLGGSDSGFANWVKSERFLNLMETGGWVALFLVFAFFVYFAVMFATGRIGGGA